NAWAERFNATLTGSVTDPSGLPVPAVELTLTPMGTGVPVRVTSGSDGLFSFPNLESGEYELRASITVFKECVQRGIHVLSNQDARVEVKLELGPETQTIQVNESVSA